MNVIETVSYEVRVQGTLWDRRKGDMWHDFDHLPTMAEVKAASGDFQSINSVRVIKHHTVTVSHVQRVNLIPEGST